MPRGFPDSYDNGSPQQQSQSPFGRDSVFYRVVVDRVQAGGSRISWLITDEFTGPSPWSFQLQIGESGVAGATDWVNVGAPVVDTFTVVDTTARDFAVQPLTHYRVVLTDAAAAVHTSPAEPSTGRLKRQDWLLARAHIRRELLQHKRRGGERGWLFKQKRRTPQSTNPQVVDPLSGRVIKTRNTGNAGTARPGGYFSPILFDICPLMDGGRGINRDEARGNIDDQQRMGVAIGFPQLDRGDVWASMTGDARYVIDKIQTKASVRNVPIIVQVSMSRLAETDPVYEIALPSVVPAPFDRRDV